MVFNILPGIFMSLAGAWPNIFEAIRATAIAGNRMELKYPELTTVHPDATTADSNALRLYRRLW